MRKLFAAPIDAMFFYCMKDGSVEQASKLTQAGHKLASLISLHPTVNNKRSPPLYLHVHQSHAKTAFFPFRPSSGPHVLLAKKEITPYSPPRERAAANWAVRKAAGHLIAFDEAKEIARRMGDLLTQNGDNETLAIHKLRFEVFATRLVALMGHPVVWALKYNSPAGRLCMKVVREFKMSPSATRPEPFRP